jgi:hypothetical protein
MIEHFYDMAYRGVLVLPEARKRAKKLQKIHPKYIKNGENASEVRRRLMDHKHIEKFI